MNHKPIEPAQDQTGDELERMLDAALAKYVVVEPRAGIEERVLANLRSEQARTARYSWWQWSLAAAVTAVLIVAVALGWRSMMKRPHWANHAPTSVQGPRTHATRTANRDGNSADRPRQAAIRRAVRTHPQAKSVAAAYPKLDQFPSPQPLSEQEKILANYVAYFPEHAALLAEARMQALLQEEEERRKTAENRDSQQ